MHFETIKKLKDVLEENINDKNNQEYIQINLISNPDIKDINIALDKLFYNVFKNEELIKLIKNEVNNYDKQIHGIKEISISFSNDIVIKNLIENYIKNLTKIIKEKNQKIVYNLDCSELELAFYLNVLKIFK